MSTQKLEDRKVIDKNYDWMDEATQIAAQCWCDPETSGKIFDPVLAKAIAVRISNWIKTCAQSQRNADYYRHQCVLVSSFLPEPYKSKMYVSDDGSKQDEPLIAKLAEVVLEMKHGKVWKEFDAKA